MAIRFTKTRAILSGNCTVEEAEGLFGWLGNNPKGELNLKEVTHLHTATAQAIAASSNVIAAWPADVFCATLLQRLRPNARAGRK